MIFTKIVITNCHESYENCHKYSSENSDNERYLQNAWKQAVFEILRLYHLKFQIPTAYGLNHMNLKKGQSHRLRKRSVLF